MEAATAEMTVVERFQLKAFVEAVMLVDEGVSNTKDVDLGMMMGAGILPGPLARADEAGLDEMLDRLELAQREWGEGFAPPLLHEPAQDQRRRERVAPLRLCPLERGEHLVEALRVGARERPGNDAGAGHHADVDVLDAGDALLEHEARLDERLQAEALDQRGGRGLSCRAHRNPFRSSRRGCRRRRVPSSRA